MAAATPKANWTRAWKGVADKAKAMSTRLRKTVTLISILLCGVILIPLLLGFIVFPRPDFPLPVSEDACSHYNIRFDGTSIETIYHAPESILADPQAFLQNDPAYMLLGEHRTRVSDPFPLDAWLKGIRTLANLLDEEREQRAPYRLYQRTMANQASFCREMVSFPGRSKASRAPVHQ